MTFIELIGYAVSFAVLLTGIAASFAGSSKADDITETGLEGLRRTNEKENK